MQLRETEPVGVLDDKRVAIRNIDSRFYYRRANENIDLSLDECRPYLRKIFLRHFAVSDLYTESRLFIKHICRFINRIYSVMKIEALTASCDFPLYGVNDYPDIVFGDISRHGVSVLRRFVQHGNIADPRHGHIQSSRYRRRGKRKNIRAF